MLAALGGMFLLLATGGGVLLALGLRGRRIDSSPLCRACGYDLADLPSANRCPECGADISSWSAVRVGRRRSQRGWIIAGAVLFAIGVVPLSLLTIDVALHGLRSRALEPTWWLLRETHSPNDVTVDVALDELVKRQSAGQLSNATIAKLARQGLVYRDTGSPCGEWHRQYGRFLDDACAGGLLAPAEVGEYWLHGVGLSWTTEAAEGDPPNRVRVSITWNPYWGPSVPLDYEIDFIGERYPRQPARLGPKPERTVVVCYRNMTDPPETVRFRVRFADPISGESIGSAWDDSLVIPLTPGKRGGVGFGGRPAYTPVR